MEDARTTGLNYLARRPVSKHVIARDRANPEWRDAPERSLLEWLIALNQVNPHEPNRLLDCLTPDILQGKLGTTNMSVRRAVFLRSQDEHPLRSTAFNMVERLSDQLAREPREVLYNEWFRAMTTAGFYHMSYRFAWITKNLMRGPAYRRLLEVGIDAAAKRGDTKMLTCCIELLKDRQLTPCMGNENDCRCITCQLQNAIWHMDPDSFLVHPYTNDRTAAATQLARQTRKAVTIMNLIQDGVGIPTLPGSMLTRRAGGEVDVPLFDNVVAMGEFQLVQAYLDADRRAKPHRYDWTVSAEKLRALLNNTVPQGEQETLEALERRAVRAGIHVPYHLRTLTRFPDEIWHLLQMNKSLIDYNAVRRLLEERIEEKRCEPIFARWGQLVTSGIIMCGVKDRWTAKEQAWKLNAEKAERVRNGGA